MLFFELVFYIFNQHQVLSILKYRRVCPHPIANGILTTLIYVRCIYSDVMRKIKSLTVTISQLGVRWPALIPEIGILIMLLII
ncbi:hypothetical protein CR152_28125 [Massilia violaceinigra]|uniref:Uncharacterized protein n=1 Tax=Massilia violaceinigra TaxID=2045208 RepID=A0A2D2DSI7_9BURK|nr:hypothetical protein CR152_28125 [Massilia violaceinigra]